MESHTPNLSPADQALLAFLSSRDATCPACNYNLRALTQPRCPECGQALVLRVSPAERHLTPWLAITIPLCLAAGIGLLIVTLLVAASLSDSTMTNLATPKVIPAISGIPLAVMAILARRRVLRLKPRPQRVLAIFAIAMFVLSLGLLLG